jgi:hypothetical protein
MRILNIIASADPETGGPIRDLDAILHSVSPRGLHEAA